MRTVLVALAASTFLVFAAGCTATDASPSEEGEEAEVVAARITAKLYDEPNKQPNPTCDLHTALTVSSTSGGMSDAVIAVYVPAALMNGRTPSSRK